MTNDGCIFLSGQMTFLRCKPPADTDQEGDQLWCHFSPSGDELGWFQSSQQLCLGLSGASFFWFTLTEHRKTKSHINGGDHKYRLARHTEDECSCDDGSGPTWYFQQKEMDIGTVGTSAWETSLQLIDWIQNSGGLPHQVPLSFIQCGKEPDHTKKWFLLVCLLHKHVCHRWDFFFIFWGGWEEKVGVLE